MKFRSIFLPLLAAACLLAACGSLVPSWKGTCNVPNQTLLYNVPCEYLVDLSQAEADFPAQIELVITYYGQTVWSELPLSLILEDQTNPEALPQELSVEIPLKKDGQLQGSPHENGIDYVHSVIAVPEISLQNHRYRLRIYANDEQEGKIYGVPAIEVRIYPQEKKES
jgi:hypothetical protein